MILGTLTTSSGFLSEDFSQSGAGFYTLFLKLSQFGGGTACLGF
jgi:hypothetical protein